MAQTLRVFLVASEAVPFAKTGGLADVAGALPKELVKLGCEVRCFMPRYRQVDCEAFGLEEAFPEERVEFAGERIACSILRAPVKDGVEWFFLDAPAYFDRDQLYGVDGKDYPDSCERFTFFAQTALSLLQKLDWRPDVVHCHDWQAGLIPAYLKLPVKTPLVDTRDSFFGGIRTLFTVHNIAYQGLFPKSKLSVTGFDECHFTPEKLEYYGQLNFLKTALILSDRLNTVSERYAEEIQTEQFGRGMEGVLAWRSKVLSGILNGIDPDEWDPGTDKHLLGHYSAGYLRGKLMCRRALLREFGLKAKKGVPLVGIISRLDPQKGFDLIEEAFDDLMGLRIQMVILGTGTPVYHEMLTKMAERYPEQLGVRLAYDNATAHRIEAGADMFLMPSKFEPCGLNQMYSLRYGTIPLVHATGGLADTITDFRAKTKTGNGFAFTEYSAKALVSAVRRAVRLYPDKRRWYGLMKRGMDEDFSWTRSAQKYRGLYRTVLS